MTIEDYYNALSKFDWFYGMSDSYEVWTKGRRREKALKACAELSPQHKDAWLRFQQWRSDTIGGLRDPKPSLYDCTQIAGQMDIYEAGA